MAAPVPPLPPVPGVSDDDVRPGGRSVLDLLADDHHMIVALCDELVSAQAGRHRIAQVAVAELCRHLSAEEQYLYPAVRATLPDGGALAERELAADAEILRALDALAPGTAGAARLAGLVRRHAHRVDAELAPTLRRACSTSVLIRLGNRVEIAREAAPTRPHPAAPATPPGNRIVDPLLGVVDKLRDLFTARTTRSEDLEHLTLPRKAQRR